jgi:hypothetical protein
LGEIIQNMSHTPGLHDPNERPAAELILKDVSKKKWLVGAEDRYRDQKEPERDRPGGDHVGAWTHPLRRAKPWTPARVARRRRCSLDEHQALTRTDFAHATTYRGSRAPARDGDRTPLAIPAALDPLAHILDVGPPSTGLRSSWHRRRC